MGKQRVSAEQRANRAALLLYGIINAVLVLCYAIEVVKGSRSIGYYAVFLILALVPWLMGELVYRANHESERIAYIIPIGFSIFYLFIIFTTTSDVAYVYAFVMAVALIILGNTRMIGVYMIIVSAGNVIQVAHMGLSGQISAERIPNVEIRLASVVMIGIYLFVSTRVLNQNNQDRLDELEKEKHHAAELTKQVLAASEQMTTNIGTLADKMNVLESTTGQTMSAMEEVTAGTSETAESVQTQMQKTEEIQHTIGEVEKSAGMMAEDIRAAREELIDSKKTIRTLIEQVDISNRANENMSDEVARLTGYTDQMQSIIDVIDNVTSQTSLLSLNASIEAARAGEAGKGFAVVASEISSLATQTQQATEDITGLINHISEELANVIRVIDTVIANTKQQNESAHHTADSFEAIDRKIDAVYAQTEHTMNLLGELEHANTAITEGIETISAVTQEVTAHSNETLSISTENSKMTGEVGAIIGRLNEMARVLSDMSDAPAAQTDGVNEE